MHKNFTTKKNFDKINIVIVFSYEYFKDIKNYLKTKKLFLNQSHLVDWCKYDFIQRHRSN